MYAKIHKLNIKSIQNKDDITFATEKIIAYEMNDAVIGVTFSLPPTNNLRSNRSSSVKI